VLLKFGDGGFHGWKQTRLLGLKQEAESAGDLETEGESDAACFEVVKNDGVMCLI
jgi:hypothetical protein